MPGRRHQPVRDQDLSAFARILQNLVDATPGALGAALVDGSGECVDYAGWLDPFDVKVAAAHWQLELRHACEELQGQVGQVRHLIVRASRKSYFSRTLEDGYVVVVVLGRCAGFGLSERALSQLDHDLRDECGWPSSSDVERWVHAQVEARDDDRRRPKRVRVLGEWYDVEVMGAVMGLKKGERGYRIRTSTGAEMTLVRERLGRWYADLRLG